jgi:hypothetical protein
LRGADIIASSQIASGSASSHSGGSACAAAPARVVGDAAGVAESYEQRWCGGPFEAMPGASCTCGSVR